MNLLPYEKLIYRSVYTPEEVLRRLAEQVDQADKPLFSWGTNKTGRPYTGKIYGRTFSIRRVINYRNSFLPKITGDVYTEYGGTRIKITMKLDDAVMAFMMVWLGMVLIICIAVLAGFLIHRTGSMTSLIPFVMLAFGSMLVCAAFNAESVRSKKDLPGLLGAEIIDL